MLTILALVIAGAAILSHSAPAPFLVEAFRPRKSIWRVPPRAGTPPTLYLTFDDGPNALWTPPLLDALREQRVRATFFLIDEHITRRLPRSSGGWPRKGTRSVCTAARAA